MMCSDGLNGYATQGAIEQVLGGAENADSATRDLVDLAKRGGGGDNVSTIVIEVGEQSPGPRANILHETGSRAWWQRRGLFIDVCERMGIASSGLTAGFEPKEAVEVLAGSFFEAVYHDLENTTGVNVWTYSDSLVRAWFGRNGGYRPVQELFDTLRAASLAVVKDVSTTDDDFGVCLEIALLRSLIVGEMVVGGQIGASIRTISDEIVASEPTSELPEATFASVATLPFAGGQTPMPAAPDVSRCLKDGLAHALRESAVAKDPLSQQVLEASHVAADEFSGEGDMATLAREIYGNRLLSEQELTPIITTVESCRLVHLNSIDKQDIVAEARATAYRSAARAHQSLAHALALVAVDAGRPTTDRLREMQESTAQMRERLARNEQHLSKLEEALDTMEESVQ
jgi:hypothetical protein